MWTTVYKNDADIYGTLEYIFCVDMILSCYGSLTLQCESLLSLCVCAFSV